MNRRVALLLSVTLFFAFGTVASAQIRTRILRASEPATWITASAGLFNANGVSDGKTASTWDFGQASVAQYRASLERSIRNQISLGVAATYLSAPFTYIGKDSEASCARCAARLDLVSLGASFHAGGGIGLHQVLQGSAGVAQYRNLRRNEGRKPLAPLDGNIDPYFTFGYGFGYTFSNAIQASVVQDFGIVLHERGDLSSEASNTLRQRTTRLNLRYGIGSRSRSR